MSKRIIHLFEAIEINKQQRSRKGGAICLLDFQSQAILKKAAVGKSGEKIIVCMPPDSFLSPLLIGDVRK